jgi:hypothetical protein
LADLTNLIPLLCFKVSYEEFVTMAMGPPPKELLANVEEDVPESGTSGLDELSPQERSLPSRSASVDKATELTHALKESIANAHKVEAGSDAPRKRDPPMLRQGRQDPPTSEIVPSVKARAAPKEPESTVPVNPIQKTAAAPKEPESTVPVNPIQETAESPVLKARKPMSDVAYNQLGSQASQIDDACKGFDRVQEKIAQLKMLLVAKETSNRRKLDGQGQSRSRPKLKQAPSADTLDGAFAKLSEIQGKMRALQALVKTNQI